MEQNPELILLTVFYYLSNNKPITHLLSALSYIKVKLTIKNNDILQKQGAHRELMRFQNTLYLIGVMTRGRFQEGIISISGVLGMDEVGSVPPVLPLVATHYVVLSVELCFAI